MFRILRAILPTLLLKVVRVARTRYKNVLPGRWEFYSLRISSQLGVFEARTVPQVIVSKQPLPILFVCISECPKAKFFKQILSARRGGL